MNKLKSIIFLLLLLPSLVFATEQSEYDYLSNKYFKKYAEIQSELVAEEMISKIVQDLSLYGKFNDTIDIKTAIEVLDTIGANPKTLCLKIGGPIGKKDFTSLKEVTKSNVSLDFSQADISLTAQFNWFDYLKEIILPEESTCIAYSAFLGCYSLEKISLPKNLISIEDKAFYNCFSLKAIEIPAKISFLGSDIFTGCDSLTDIYFSGTKSTWKKITKNDKNLSSGKISTSNGIKKVNLHFDNS